MDRPRGGRPRDEHVHAAILTATRDLLIDGSYTALTMDAVASRAGVGKKSLYRRWPSKAPLVAEAVLDAYGSTGSFDVPDTGDLRADLRSWLTDHAEFIADTRNAALVRALIAASAASSADNADLHDRLEIPQRDGLTSRLRRAIDDGSIRPDTDIDGLAHALIGTLLLGVLVGRRGGSPSASLVDTLLDGCAPKT